MEFLRGIVEGLASHWFIWLCSGGTAVTLAALKTFRPQWAPIVLYGLAGFVGVFTLFVMAEVQVRLSDLNRDITIINNKIPERSPEVTPETIEANIREWSNHLGFSTRREPDGDSYFLSYVLTLKNGFHVTVRKTNERENFLTFLGRLRVSATHKKAFEQLPARGQIQFVNNLGLELSRAKIGFSINMPESITIETGVPITSTLTEYSFLEKVSETDLAMVLARGVVREELGGN